jgi:hypothetical protein
MGRTQGKVQLNSQGLSNVWNWNVLVRTQDNEYISPKYEYITMTLFRRPVIRFTSSPLRPLIGTLFQHRHYRRPPWDETIISSLRARSNGFTAVTTSLKNTLFWDMASCSLIYISRCYEGMRYLHIHSLRVIILHRRLFFSSAQFTAARYISLRPVLI